ncbi:hypothetical protein ACFQ1E_03080 [Sphingomonas canadensis]|uniref:Uncharacterized protein n=1 Tax=Sphingomonas canadensis TaxID=1219257 RepID=A0ABW3H1I4_9SPHN|nr:hypothetical protein [Sphingomonas canadensis]MCW3834774.1 hypothetical protein [Sphingomonas canadensis]
MTQVPPTRYRVVERGRRLEVIDTWARDGVPERPRSPLPAAGRRDARQPRNAQPRPAAPRRPAPAGSRTLVTSRWYDAKGPRAILLSAEAERKLGGARTTAIGAGVAALVFAALFWPLSLVALLFALFRAGAIRGWITVWLDKLDQADGEGSSARAG